MLAVQAVTALKRIRMNNPAQSNQRRDVRLQELRGNFRDLILTTCNVIGCDKCPSKFDGGCKSDVIQNEILDIEMSEFSLS